MKRDLERIDRVQEHPLLKVSHLLVLGEFLIESDAIVANQLA